LGTNILDAGGFDETRPHESGQLAESIEKADGFAQVFPEHKFHIVDVLQQRNHIVGMTGDGVNDAPALKKADCGIAVSGATDSARAAADIVLLTPGLSVIIDAIKESRKIFQRMNSYSIYRIAETIRVLLFMTLSILVFNFYPVTAVMIVLLALLNDGAILSIAYDEVHYSNLPEAWNMPVVLGIATVLGIAGVLASFGLFYLGERVFYLNREIIQSLMYLKLSVAGHLDYLCDTHPRAILVHPPGTRFTRGGHWNSDHCHANRGLRFSHAGHRLGLGPGGLGLRVGVVFRQRSGQAGSVPDLRYAPSRIVNAESFPAGINRFRKLRTVVSGSARGFELPEHAEYACAIL
jgi:hypothetical protein